jgi:hypothetical protein
LFDKPVAVPWWNGLKLRLTLIMDRKVLNLRRILVRGNPG